MIPLIDIHCHLFAGLDDGPATEEDALAMCRLAYSNGTRMVAATAHQNEEYPEVTPQRIRSACERLVQLLHDADIPLAVFPTAEVMVHADVVSAWTDGLLLSMADRRRYLLIELPHGLFLDLESLVRTFVAKRNAAGSIASPRPADDAGRPIHQSPPGNWRALPPLASRCRQSAQGS